MQFPTPRCWRILFAVVYSLTLSCDLARAWAEAPRQNTLLPDAQGKGLVLATCTQCHNLASIVAQRKNIEGWQRTVRDMVARGAQVRPEEIAVISDYLASSFGTDAPATDTGLKQAGAGPAFTSQVSGKYSPPIPEGPGRVLVLSSCTDCHGLNKITEQRKDERGWRAAVNDMVRLGAKVKPADVETVVSYLALNFGPQLGVVGSASTQAAGPGRPADLSRLLPDGEGKGLILATCVQCHGLQEIVGQRKDAEGWMRTVQDMVSRGAQITPEEVDLITSYLARRMAR